MGSGGRAIGPDGKPIKNNSSSNINKSGPPAPNGRGVRGGRMVKDRMGGPGPMRGPMHGPGGPMMGGGPMGPRGGPMGGYGGGPGGPMGNRGPMGPGGPGGPNQGMGGGPMGGNGIMAPIRGSGPDPHGNFGFFRDVPINQLPANRLGMMSDDRMGSKQPGGGGSGLTPSAQTVGGGNGPIGGGPNRGMQQQHAPQQQQQMKQSGPTPLMSIGVSQQGPTPVSQPAAAHSNSNTSQPAAAPAAQPGGAVPVPGDVPGFGTNSSIHELFGKMVWRKMEGLRDQSVVDRLQNRIMNLIHDALADQNAAPQPASQQPPQQPANNMMMNNGMGAPQQQQRTSGLNFRSF